MNPLRLGRCVPQCRPPLGPTAYPLFHLRSQCCYSVRLQSSAVAKLDADGKPVKRGRGRPRKSELPQKLPSATISHTFPPSDITPEVLQPPQSTSSASDIDTPSNHSSAQAEPTLPSSRPSASFPTAHSRHKLPSPPVSAAHTSAKLAALHSRLSLSKQIPLETLARTLVDASADSDPRFNNSSLGVLGNDLLGYYMSEHLLCHFPRLPMAVLFAAQNAYVGPRALTALSQEWGVEAVAEPGGEVDPGLLQFKRMVSGTEMEDPKKGNRPDKYIHWRRGMSSRVVYDDQFGDIRLPTQESTPTASPRPSDTEQTPTSLDDASATFVRALFAAFYLHAGAQPTHTFFSNHILSRQLDLGSLFTFTQPTRDLSRLCAREGFEPPVARILSETGRLTQSPVFVVGVFSGKDELGQAAGASLNEARWKAAARALKGWYLYSPSNSLAVGLGQGVMVPSITERDKTMAQKWRPAVIDDGEIIV